MAGERDGLNEHGLVIFGFESSCKLNMPGVAD
jgi:hypothetical protein